MSEGGKRSSSNGFEKPLTTEDQQARVYPSYVLVSFTSTYGRKNLKHTTLSILKVNDMRRLVGPLPDKIRCPFIVLMHQLQDF